MLRCLLVLNNKRRLSHRGPIAEAYDHLVQESYGRVEVDLYTPGRLDEEDLELIRSRIRDAIGREPVLYSYTDPSMIGGVKMRIGDQLIDGSVASQRRRLRHGRLTSGGPVVRGRLGAFFEEESGS